ncbi:MAG: miniconductance mechanosensitive channel [Gammaproteobacteria bacterium]|jgi:miniconductance mechanosensitive channel
MLSENVPPLPLEESGAGSQIVQMLKELAPIWLAVLVAAFLANFIAKKVIVRAARAVIERTRAKWDDVLVEHHVFERLSQLAPALVFYLAAPRLFEGDSGIYSGYVQNFAMVWMYIAGARTVNSLLDSLVTLGMRSKGARDKPLRSYSQVLKIVLWLGVGIVTVATLMNKSPWALLTGLGAMTAIILLVFKDSIMGFVASIQIAGNDMLRTGDWVEMPKYGADGDVIEIGLHTVKIQNWDMTVTTIPTYAFMTDSFKNWRGMTESGGRRIKRSLSFDMGSVRFLEEDDLVRLRRVQFIEEYLLEKAKEVQAWNKEKGVAETSLVNGRRLTNLGSFRAYVERYLSHIPDIREDMTFLVRQLPPGPEGLPIEIYVFSGEQRWVQYEALMADIFDHLLSIVGEFDLRIYQRPSGTDLQSLTASGFSSPA